VDTSWHTGSVSFTSPLFVAHSAYFATTHAPFLAPAMRSQMLPPPASSHH